MNNSAALWSLPTLTLVVLGMDHVSGSPLFTLVSTFLSQNGF